MGIPSLDSRIDALYDLPLGDFVAGRKALTDELRRAGDREDATTVKGLTKPSQSAWITNQALRREPALVQQLLAATQELGAAQRAAARTVDTQQRFQEARAEQRRVIERLMDVARAVVTSDGVAPGTTSPHLEKVERNLTWGPLSSRDDLLAFQRGRLLTDVAPPGFAALAGGDEASVRIAAPGERSAPAGQVPAPGAAPPVSDGDQNDNKAPTRLAAQERQAAQRQAQEARAEQHRIQQKQAAEARAILLRARAETARARQILERTARTRDQERLNVDKATRELDAARVALDAAETAHKDARAAVDACEKAEANARQSAP